VDPVTFGSCKLPGESADPPSRENTDADAAYQTEMGMVCKTDVTPNASVSYRRAKDTYNYKSKQ
jgi:hypothetical protein